MNWLVLINMLLSFVFTASADVEKMLEQPGWQAIFESHAAVGTLVILDQRNTASHWTVFNAPRSKDPFPPASTFKIPHALFALDAGIIEDEFQVFAWDGVARPVAEHNQHQTLLSSMRYSTVWVYEQFGEQIGEAQAQQYLSRIQYGNADPSSETRRYWIDGNLRISAQQQIAFLQQLYLNALPFDEADQRLVKDVILVEAGRDWRLRAKTGWEGDIGWWVGWVEWPTGPVFFALNIDTPNGLDDLFKREAITRRVLQSLDALPVE